MAVGTVEIETLEQMVKAITRHYTAVKFSSVEMRNALNAAQGKVFTLLPSGVKSSLYGDKHDYDAPTGSSGEYVVDLSTENPYDVNAVRRYSVTDGVVPMFHADLDFVLSVWENSYRQGVYWAKHGDALYLSEELPAPGDKVRVYYIKSPVDMDESNDLDLPDEYRRYLVLTAALDLLSYAQDVGADKVTSARQEVVVEGRTLGLHPDIKGSKAEIDDTASSENGEPIAQGGE